MFAKGTIVSIICLVWFIIHDRKEQRRKNPPVTTTTSSKVNTDNSESTDEETDPLIQSWREECRKADELLKRHPVSDD